MNTNATEVKGDLLVEWSDELSVGIEEIDDQHKVLVDLLNQLHAAIHERRGNDVALPILNRLIEYTRIHFAVEESLMRILNYPDFETHKEHHEQLIDQVLEMHQKVIKDNKKLGFELLHFLKNWLTKHIMSEDKLYTPHFIRCGASTTHDRSVIGKLFQFWK
ncbi:bacteriohemerythrin [Teredinibacter sp. KSP-S5-2]|uniref:bacteriohemerythrin n=1 Tax=Teredinibacter sp. KSP-S5-2 TaxID=3034506 RepID=UPI002934A625|nr:bacteriohemerythrin [Teredinibacter sp. KSP-S5-2]WNO11127.1 bacteriohemerythrin [Teredinibacter sp. KSP-S5-2]